MTATNNAAAAAIEPLRKITVKTVCGAVDFTALMAIEGDVKMITLMEVYGVAGRYKPGSSDYGDFVKFIGQFRAKNLQNGRVFKSAVLLLPKFLEEELSGAMITGDGEIRNAEFAVRISVKFDAESATKYVYIAENMIEPQETDALKSLESRIASTLALAAPKADATDTAAGAAPESEPAKSGKKK